jgi:F0F1-type ATP synthase membrane subunit c/vacuolar-type H+-ATPase subunit K
LLIRRRRWAGWLFIASGIVIGFCAAYAAAMPRLVSSTWGQRSGDTPGSGLFVLGLIAMAIMASLAMLASGGAALWASRRPHCPQQAEHTATRRQRP